MRQWQWVIAALALLALLLIAFAFNVMAQPRPAALEPISPLYEEHIIELDRQAMDAAYEDRLQHLFAVWTVDDTDQPQRVIAGANKARRAYIAAMQAIDKRARELKELQQKGK